MAAEAQLRTNRRSARAIRITVSAVALLGPVLVCLAFVQLRQALLDRALVAAVQSPGASLASVQALLDRGANPNAREVYLPSVSASPQGLREAADWLRRPERRTGFPVLVAAACSGRADLVRELLSRGADVQTPSSDSYTVLIYRSQSQAPNGLEITRMLLDGGADVNAATDRGRTALMFAVCYHKSEVVRLLLSRGADPNARDDRGHTPLRYGIGSGNIEPDSVRALMEYGADVNARATDGMTPLGRALQARSSPAILRILREAGARR